MVNPDDGSLPPPVTSRTEAWPFLVSAGRTVPQRVILAPPFLIAEKRTYLLFRATGSAEEHTELEKTSGITWICKVSDEDSGEFATVFRITRATAEMIGEEGHPLLDFSSRPVYFIDGIVVRGSTVNLSEAAMEQARVITLQEFASFWKADDRSVSTKSAAPLITTDQNSARPPLALTKLPPITYTSPTTGSSDKSEKDQSIPSLDLRQPAEKNQSTPSVNLRQPIATTTAFPNTRRRADGSPSRDSARLGCTKRLKSWLFLIALAVAITIIVVIATILVPLHLDGRSL